jgi:hypothetical protein
VRNSDRLVTPGVVIVSVLVAGGCVLATIVAVAWLTARGLDPNPMLKLVGQAVTALGSLGAFLLTLTGRVQASKIERNTGLLANKTHELAGAVYEVADAMPRPVTASRHAYPETAEQTAAPAPRGS